MMWTWRRLRYSMLQAARTRGHGACAVGAAVNEVDTAVYFLGNAALVARE
jgi:hypothetical protein